MNNVDCGGQKIVNTIPDYDCDRHANLTVQTPEQGFEYKTH